MTFRQRRVIHESCHAEHKSIDFREFLFITILTSSESRWQIKKRVKLNVELNHRQKSLVIFFIKFIFRSTFFVCLFHEMSKKIQLQQFFSFALKTFLPSRDWLPEKKTLQKYDKSTSYSKSNIYFSVWCPITIVASHWKFRLARRETCNCADLFWNFLHFFFRLWKYRKRFKPLSKLIEKRFHRIDKSLVWLFFSPWKVKLSCKL